MSKLTQFMAEVAGDLKPAFEAGRADAATLFTTMTLGGTPLAGEAGVAAQADAGPPAGSQQAIAEPAPQVTELDPGYRAFLAEQSAAASQPQQQQQMEIG